MSTSDYNAVSSPVPAFTEQELKRISTASPEIQTAVAELLSQKLAPEQLVLSVREVLAAEAGHAPVGNDIMVATPTGQALDNELGIAAQQSANGQTSITDADIALLKSRVESTVKQMIASGASDEDIQKAVAGMGSTPELASLAQEMAQQQLDAEKFNLFNTRDANGQGADVGAGFSVVGAIAAAVGGAVMAAEPEQAVEGVTAARMPFLDMGSTTAALAFNPPPVPNVPDVRDRSQQRSV